MEKTYTRHQFWLARKFYIDVDYIPMVGDIIQEANSNQEEEFKILKYLNEEEIEALDLQTNTKRYFFTDSVKPHPAELKRQKKKLILARKQADWQRKEERKKARALKILTKLDKEKKKKAKKFSHKKKKELKIKFI